MLYLIRRVEEEIARIYPSDKIQSPIHLSIGQEAISVGVCAALQKSDIVFGTYRGHALYLSKGGDLKKLIAELYGKASGCCGGKGGSLHLASIENGFMGTSAVVASGIPHAVGYAYALKCKGTVPLKGLSPLVACFFGDGATEEGVFFESLNFAALKKLPVLFVCENNELAVHSRQSERQSVCNITGKAAAFGIPTDLLAGDDLAGIYKKTCECVEAMRSGKSGPYFMECKVSRWREHVGPSEDFQFGYRLRGEVEPWMAKDPVRIFRAKLSDSEALRIEKEVDQEIQEAFEFAEKSPVPEPAELYTDVIEES